jgi:NAD(P)-dependent dehydrogenase (short-subunit alcohol dehydrogenase family)
MPGVLVAGGAGALGGAVVDDLVGAGWSVSVVDPHTHPTAAHASLQSEQLDTEDARGAVEAVADLRAVVNLVGGFAMGPKVEDAELAAFERMLRLNLFPLFNLAHAAMPRLAADGGGAFVGVSARAALQPFPGATGYITAKAGVLALVKALDAEYRDAGVRCNAVLPSVIDTPANRESMPDADWSKWVPPQQIARVVRFLCSEDSAPTSGAAVPVYGRA